MNPITLLHDYGIHIATVVLIIGLLTLIYILSYAYKNPKKIRISDIIFAITSAILIAFSFVLYLVAYGMI